MNLSPKNASHAWTIYVFPNIGKIYQACDGLVPPYKLPIFNAEAEPEFDPWNYGIQSFENNLE